MALKHLFDEFGEKLYEKKVLLLHAGGLSQRQPNGSVLGKIFQLVPTKLNRPMTLFELKLRIYNQFLPLMKAGGVFLAAADSLEYFGTSLIDAVLEKSSGFTVVGHPSPLFVGVNHGVYILDQREEKTNAKFDGADVFTSTVRKILQKPSIDEMYKWQAVVIDQKTKNEFIYSDSCYFFAADVIERLLSFFHRHKCRTNVEIDAYGDFLQPLGVDSTLDYVEKTNCPSKELSVVRRELYDLLNDVDVRAFLFPRSKFYHLGTFKELIDFYCCDEKFLDEFEFCRRCFVDLVGEPPKNFTPSIDGCVMCCRLKFDSVVPDKCLIEVCDFPNGIELENSSILSNCRSNKRQKLPPNVFLTTLAVDGDGGVVSFVTVFFAVYENLKQSYDKIDEVTFLNVRLVDALNIWRFKKSTFDDDKPRALWYAKIFPSFSTMEESFDDAVERIRRLNAVTPTATDVDNVTHYSMHDCIKRKNVGEILKWRKILFDDIRKVLI